MDTAYLFNSYFESSVNDLIEVICQENVRLRKTSCEQPHGENKSEAVAHRHVSASLCRVL